MPKKYTSKTKKTVSHNENPLEVPHVQELEEVISPTPPAESPKTCWCFIINNYKREDIDNLNKIYNLDVPDVPAFFKFLIFSEEIGKRNKIPHLQGYFELHGKKRKNTLLKNLSSIPSISLMPAKGQREDNIKYILKDTINPVYKNGHTLRRVKIINKDDFYGFQKFVFELSEKEPDDRHIYYFYQKKGNCGKTAIIKYLIAKKGACFVGYDKKNDIYNAIVNHYKSHDGEYPNILCINIPKATNPKYISMSAIECLKDGLFFSGKYESEGQLMPNPHIFIFSNAPPLVDGLSLDKWKIYQVDKNKCTKKRTSYFLNSTKCYNDESEGKEYSEIIND